MSKKPEKILSKIAVIRNFYYVLSYFNRRRWYQRVATDSKFLNINVTTDLVALVVDVVPAVASRRSVLVTAVSQEHSR